MILNSILGRHALRIAVGITALVLLMAGGAGAATPIDACTTISSPGTYVLTQNIINSTASTCINITSSNVVFDGAGYTIDGVDAATGVFVYNLTNVTVKNLIVTDWDTGILYTDALNGSIINNTVNSNNYGIWLFVSNNTITNNTANSNGYGIYLFVSDNNTITNNIVNSNFYGILLALFNINNTITNNTANSNFFEGISIWGSSNNTITNNTANSNGVGISIDLSVVSSAAPYTTSNYNTLIGNTANSNSKYGIYLRSTTNNIIYNNFFYNTNNSYISAFLDMESFPVSPNYWNATKVIGTNIIGGSYLGGNFWANPSGTGFSQTCTDADKDGICDSPYVLDANNTDYLPLAYKSAITPTPTPTPIPTPLLVSSITPNSRNAQVGTPVTIFMSVINGGSATATNVSITQASGLLVNTQFRQWNGTAFIEALNAPVNISAGGTANFVVGINATAVFNTSSLTFNVSSTNGATAPISGVNTLTMSASTVPSADIIMMSTSLAVSTPVYTPTVFALATVNVGGANATGVSLVLSVPPSISGLSYQVNETYPANGTVKGQATGLTINVGATPTFVVFVTPTAAIANDPANNRITLQLKDGSGKIIGAQSVAISTT